MRTTRCAIVAAILSTAFIAGCGEGDENKPVPLQKTDTSQFDEMKDAMTKNLKANQAKK